MHRVNQGWGIFCSRKCRFDYGERLEVITHRFWSHVDVSEPDKCWVWKMCLANKYGTFSYRVCRKKIEVSSHVFSYQLSFGGVGDKHVLHFCDNPPCVNPNHLFLGTHSDNMKDMISKGRGSPKYGEYSGKSKLTNDSARRVHQLRAQGWKYEDIATELHVADSTVGNVITGVSWGHIYREVHAL